MIAPYFYFLLGMRHGVHWLLCNIFSFSRVSSERIENLNFFFPFWAIYLTIITWHQSTCKRHRTPGPRASNYVRPNRMGWYEGHCAFKQMFSKRNNRYRIVSSCIKIYIKIGTRVSETITITTPLVWRTIQCKTMSAGQIRGVFVIYAKEFTHCLKKKSLMRRV